jgi:copper(I)-binding protein
LAGLAVVVPSFGCAGESAEVSGIEVSRVYVAKPTTGERTAMYFTVTNSGEAEEELLRVTTPAAGVAEIHRTVEDGGMMRMEPVSSVTIPAGASVRLEPGGYHVMLMELKDHLWSGDHVDATLHFRHMGEVAVRPKVVAYSELERLLDEPEG